MSVALVVKTTEAGRTGPSNEPPGGFTKVGGLLIPIEARDRMEQEQDAQLAAARQERRDKVPRGPNDLGSIDTKSQTLLADIRALAARVLTESVLREVDVHSGKLFMELFVGASLVTAFDETRPSTWAEVLLFLDDTAPGSWDSPAQMVLHLQHFDVDSIGYKFDREMLAFLRGMENETLSIMLKRCRLVLKRAIDAATEKLDAQPDVPSNKTATVSIFAPQEIERALGTVGKMDNKIRERVQQSLTAAASGDGSRELPDTRKARANLGRLADDFENLSEPIEYLRNELALAGVMPPDDFRIAPILLLGEPGIGKTYLALQLANALGVPMHKISAGSAQSGFQLTGSHPSWTHATLGSVFSILADGHSATPVLVIDEVDKIRDSNYPIMPTLLDLLELNTAKAFKDEFLGMSFDASRIIVVLTANEQDPIPSMLLSRVSLFEVPLAEPPQRLRIIQSEFERLQRKSRRRVKLDMAAAEALAARTDIDLRKTVRLVAEGLAGALTEGKTVVSPKSDVQGARRQSVGFVR